MNCEFNQSGRCYAMTCYSSEKCKAKYKNGQPNYVSIKEHNKWFKRWIKKQIRKRIKCQ